MDIKTYRLTEGLTQAQMADRVSAVGKPCTQSHISQWENGQMAFTPERATQIELATNGAVSRVELIFGPPPDCEEVDRPQQEAA